MKLVYKLKFSKVLPFKSTINFLKSYISIMRYIYVGTRLDFRPKVWLDPSPVSPIQWICRKCVEKLGSNE